MVIKKEDLVFDHYLWNDLTTAMRVDANPTRKLFDRNNGTHVLWVANWYASEYETFEKADIGKLEMLISEKMPLNMLSEKSVCNWLVTTL